MVLLIINAMGVTGPLWKLLDGWVHGTIMTATFNGVTTGLYTVDAGLGQGCVLSALLFLMFIRTVTDAPPIMSADYPFKNLVEKLHALCLPKDAGVSTDRTPMQQKIPAVLAADDTTLVANSRGDMIRLTTALYAWKFMSRYETNDTKFHLLVHAAKMTRINTEVRAYRSAHVGYESISLPGRNVSTCSESSAILLGCQLMSDSKDNIML